MPSWSYRGWYQDGWQKMGSKGKAARPWTPCSCGGWCYDHKKQVACTRCGTPLGVPQQGPGGAAPPQPAGNPDCSKPGGFQGMDPALQAEVLAALQPLADKLPPFMGVLLGMGSKEEVVPPTEHAALKALTQARVARDKAVAAKTRALSATAKVEAQLQEAKKVEAQAQQEADAAEAAFARAASVLDQVVAAKAAPAQAKDGETLKAQISQKQQELQQMQKDLAVVEAAAAEAVAEAAAAAKDASVAPCAGAGLDDPEATNFEEDPAADAEMQAVFEEEEKKRRAQLEQVAGEIEETKRRGLQAEATISKAKGTKAAAAAAVAARAAGAAEPSQSSG